MNRRKFVKYLLAIPAALLGITCVGKPKRSVWQDSIDRLYADKERLTMADHLKDGPVKEELLGYWRADWEMPSKPKKMHINNIEINKNGNLVVRVKDK